MLDSKETVDVTVETYKGAGTGEIVDEIEKAIARDYPDAGHHYITPDWTSVDVGTRMYSMNLQTYINNANIVNRRKYNA